MLKALLIAAVAFGVLSFLANRSIYYPMREGLWELRAQIGASDVWLTAADGVKLHAWWVPAPEPRVVTLFLHGNAGNLSHRIDHIREITAAGSSILVLDYRGYGKSQGRPTEKGLYADAGAAYAYLVAQGHTRLVIHGESLGTAVAVDLASRKPCAGLVLEAPFSSARAVAARVLPLIGPLLVWSYDSKSKIQRVACPVLVIHGDRDEVIDYSLGRELFAAAHEPKRFWTVEHAGHNDLLEVARPHYGRRLADFYASL